MHRERFMRRTNRAWFAWAALVAGAWVVVATLLWSLAVPTTVNGCAIGGLLIGAGVLARYTALARSLTVILALWLIVSTLVLPAVDALYVSNLLTGAVVLGLAIAPRKRAEAVLEWPDIPAPPDHEPIVLVPRDVASEGSHAGRGTMW